MAVEGVPDSAADPQNEVLFVAVAVHALREWQQVQTTIHLLWAA